MEFFEPHYELPWPPHSVLIFSHTPSPPTGGHFLVVTPPPFKRDIIIIKPDMYIFCNVQYDLIHLEKPMPCDYLHLVVLRAFDMSVYSMVPEVLVKL